MRRQRAALGLSRAKRITGIPFQALLFAAGTGAICRAGGGGGGGRRVQQRNVAFCTASLCFLGGWPPPPPPPLPPLAVASNGLFLVSLASHSFCSALTLSATVTTASKLAEVYWGGGFPCCISRTAAVVIARLAKLRGFDRAAEILAGTKCGSLYRILHARLGEGG